MAYTHLGAARTPAPSKAKSLPVVRRPAPKPSTLATAAKRPARQIKPPPPPLPPAPSKMTAAQMAERLVQIIARENKLREGVTELAANARKDTLRCKAASAALVKARNEVKRLMTLRRSMKSPVSVAQLAKAHHDAREAAREAAAAAADLKAVKAGLIVWLAALRKAKSDTLRARKALLAMGAVPASVPPAPSASPDIATADKQAEAVTAQVTKDVEQAVTTVVDETKALVSDAKEAAPEVVADLQDSIKEAQAPTENAEAASNSAGGDGKGMPLMPLLAASVVGLLLLRR